MARQNAILKSLGLTVLLALGFDTVIGAVAGWCWLTVNGHRRWNDFPEASRGARVDFLQNGTPLIQVRGTPKGQIYRNWDGKEITMDQKEQERVLRNFGVELVGPETLDKTVFPLPYRQRTAAFTDFSGNEWFFIHDGRRNGRGYFVGYYSRSRQRIGYLGKKGFQTTLPTDKEQLEVDGRHMAGDSKKAAFFCNTSERFSDLYNVLSVSSASFDPWKIIMISGGRLIEVNLRNRTVKPFGKVQNPLDVDITERALPLDKNYALLSPEERKLCLVARTPERIVLLDAHGKEIRSFIIPQELRNQSFEFNETLGRTAFLSKRLPIPEEYGVREVVFQIDPSGKILKREEFTLGINLRPYARTDAWQYAIAQPAPLALMLYPGVVDPLIFPFRGFSSSKNILLPTIREGWPPLVTILLISLILSAWCYRRHHRYAQPGAAAWAVFVFLFGLPGFLAYLFHRRWPVLETCPACGKAVPRDRLACAACHSSFPTPPRKGTEVFG